MNEPDPPEIVILDTCLRQIQCGMLFFVCILAASGVFFLILSRGYWADLASLAPDGYDPYLVLDFFLTIAASVVLGLIFGCYLAVIVWDGILKR